MPSYRVYFWRETAPGPAPQSVVGYESSEFELAGVRDVGEVLAWAEATAAGGSTYTLYAVVELGGERGLVRLAGADPTAPP